MTNKGMIGDYWSPRSYITITKFCRVEGSMLNHRKVGEVTSAPKDIGRIKDN